VEFLEIYIVTMQDIADTWKRPQMHVFSNVLACSEEVDEE
jgi:hypothetical protein